MLVYFLWIPVSAFFLRIQIEWDYVKLDEETNVRRNRKKLFVKGIYTGWRIPKSRCEYKEKLIDWKKKKTWAKLSWVLVQIFARYNPSYIRQKMISCRENNHSVVFHNVVKKTTDLSRELGLFFHRSWKCAQVDESILFVLSINFRLTLLRKRTNNGFSSINFFPLSILQSSIFNS